MSDQRYKIQPILCEMDPAVYLNAKKHVNYQLHFTGKYSTFLIQGALYMDTLVSERLLLYQACRLHRSGLCLSLELHKRVKNNEMDRIHSCRYTNKHWHSSTMGSC
jgi:hypothetical protein